MKSFPKRGDIFWVMLDPTVGSEINKTRPALIVSTDVGNEVASRVIVAPITSSSMQRVYPFEVPVTIKSKSCKVLLDQVRSIDKSRLGSKVLSLEQDVMQDVDKALKIALGLT